MRITVQNYHRGSRQKLKSSLFSSVNNSNCDYCRISGISKIGRSQRSQGQITKWPALGRFALRVLLVLFVLLAYVFIPGPKRHLKRPWHGIAYLQLKCP